MQKADKLLKTVAYALGVGRYTIDYWGIFTGVNPFAKVKSPKVNNEPIRFLTKEEASNL